MNVIHTSAECYPVAKVGGLADVVGSLPKYLNRQGIQASVIMPKYANEWTRNHDFNSCVYEGEAPLGSSDFEFAILDFGDELGFPLYLVDIPSRFERPGIYTDPYTGVGYWDELERFLCFQIAVLDWIRTGKTDPDLVHCHDHHTGLIPFMMTQCYRYDTLKTIPTVLTVHNGQYHGIYDRTKDQLIPSFNAGRQGLLDWDGKLNSLAAGLKCAWQITTVSKTYMEELAERSNGLELLFQNEKQKSTGIVNGIDTEVWNPGTDSYLNHHYSVQTRAEGKARNKKELCRKFGLDPSIPTVSFIGRLIYEKGADLLPGLFKKFLNKKEKVNFVILGTGDPVLHEYFHQMNEKYVGFFDATLDFNEPLAHLIYAGSDFLLMPSRVEPCGLNQMYAMRYGTVPIVRNVGGLRDTVTDIEKENGYGLTFDELSLDAASRVLNRALEMYEDKREIDRIRKRMMELNFSWNASAKEYINMYNKVIGQ